MKRLSIIMILCIVTLCAGCTSKAEPFENSNSQIAHNAASKAESGSNAQSTHNETSEEPYISTENSIDDEEINTFDSLAIGVSQSHQLYRRFLRGEIKVTEMKEDKKGAASSEESEQYCIGDLVELGLYRYIFLDLNDDGIDEMILFDNDRIMSLFTVDSESNGVLWIGNPFYTGCSEVGICNDNTLVMFDSEHPGRDSVFVAHYGGGSEIKYTVLNGEFYDPPHYLVEEETWTITESDTTVNISEEEYASKVADIRSKMIDPEWQEVARNTMRKDTSDRIDTQVLPHSLNDFLVELMMVDAFGEETGYDCEIDDGTQGMPSILYDILNQFSCIDYSLYPIVGGETEYCFDKDHLDYLPRREGNKVEYVQQDPLGIFAADDAWMSIYGYRKYEARGIDWVLKNVFNCSDSAIEKMREGVYGDPGEMFPYYYHDGYYYAAETSGFGWVSIYHVDLLEAVKKGNKYEIVYQEVITNGGSYHAESTKTMEATVELKNVDGIEFWSLYRRKVRTDGLKLQPVRQEDAASKESMDVADRIIDKVGLENALSIDEYTSSSHEDDLIVLLTEQGGVKIYDCIPAESNAEQVHTYVIEGHGKTIYIDGLFLPERSDFKAFVTKCGSTLVAYKTVLGTGTMIEELILLPSYNLEGEYVFFRIPRDLMFNQIQENLELSFDKSTSDMAIKNVKSDMVDGIIPLKDVDELKGLPFDGMELGANIAEYSRMQEMLLTACFYPVAGTDIFGIIAGEVRIPIYFTENIDYDAFTGCIHVGCVYSGISY